MSLQRRLILAFVAVAVLSVACVAAITSRATRTEFQRYLFGPPRAGPGAGMPHARDAGMQAMMRRMMGAPELRFLAALRRATWLAALVGVVAAVLLGIAVTRYLTAPLRQMAEAAGQIGQGQLAQRVTVPADDELGALARAFNAMAANLQRLEESRRQLGADIAHELRTPLSVLQANLEGMLDGVVAPSPERLAALHGQVRLLSRLVDDLRDLSLAQAGQLPLHRRPTDLAALAAEAVAAVAAAAEEKQIHVDSRVAGPVSPVSVDRERVLQMLHNLLHNALRHTPRGGRVTVGVDAGPGRVQLWVQDTGPGIPPEDLERIFERFVRLDASRTRATGGSGLGLAIVRALAEAHGGTVTATSAPGQGSRFTITLPVVTGDASAAGPAQDGADVS
ncbi:MAG: ATP-binding protein [Armatimonadota bacterium]|nr:ATP-binding protein [Armatimonadota bacterium]